MKKTATIFAAAMMITLSGCAYDFNNTTQDTMPTLQTVDTLAETTAATALTVIPEVTEAALPVAATVSEAQTEPAVTLSREELDLLDSECKGYGQGLQVDDKNRPTGAAAIQTELEKYGFVAMLDNDEEIYLTFDQGYENGYTSSILDTLKEKQVSAVFFLTGDYARRNEELVQRMIDEGHVLGNHGWAHASLPKLSVEEAEAEINELHNYVLDKFGYEMHYFRPPCGEYSERACAIAQNLGYTTTLWSFAYADWDVNNQPDVETAYTRVSDAAHGGGIFLLHSVSATNTEILPRVIDSFREQGFTLAGLPNG